MIDTDFLKSPEHRARNKLRAQLGMMPGLPQPPVMMPLVLSIITDGLVHEPASSSCFLGVLECWPLPVTSMRLLRGTMLGVCVVPDPAICTPAAPWVLCANPVNEGLKPKLTTKNVFVRNFCFLH